MKWKAQNCEASTLSVGALFVLEAIHQAGSGRVASIVSTRSGQTK